MGQKLSAIQSVLKFKKNCTMSGSANDNFVAPGRKNDAVDHESEDGIHDLATAITIDEDRTSNDHQHFEEIYNSNSDLINDYDQIDGPVMSTADSSSEMKVSGERDDDGFPKTDAFSVNKLKNKLGKKLTQDVSSGKKKKNHWVLKFNCSTLKSISSSSIFADSDIPVQDPDADSCVCTRFRRTENQVANESDVSSSLPIFIPKQQLEQLERRESTSRSLANISHDTGTEGTSTDLQSTQPFIDLSKFKPEDYPIEDCDERARLERAREIAEGVDPPPGFSPANPEFEVVYNVNLNLDNLKALFQSALSLSALSQIDVPRSVHSQIDYIHCLVPDLREITSCSFYWGKMDRYEAERLLENKPEGTFLLRDSAQEEHLFSVSFRKYNRSLHARIEQWNHQFSFDSHDPAVFASNTVCGLIGHYKDPTCYMFFEPMLTIPLPRNFPFSLQHLCRAVICDHLTYDSISYLKLPKKLKTYLKEYHYKQRVRVRKFDSEP